MFSLLSKMTEIISKEFQCQYCQFSSKVRSSLHNHVQTEHEGVIFVCSNCDYTAKLEQSLQRHIAAVHNGEKYSCTHCDYKTTS